MTRVDEANSRPVIAAAVVAGIFMLVSGLSYRVLAARLAAPATTTPIAAEDVARFPMQIGDWTGEEASVDEEIVRATATDAHISRRYSRRGGLESVSLWVACGVQARDLMPHRPEVCYTGSGWTLKGRQSVQLPLSDGTQLPCNVLEFSRGALNVQKIMVLYYYLVDGQYSPGVSLLRSKAWRGSGTVGYVAQVQITTPVSTTMTADSATKFVSAFAVDSAGHLAGLFEHAEPGASSDERETTPDAES